MKVKVNYEGISRQDCFKFEKFEKVACAAAAGSLLAHDEH